MNNITQELHNLTDEQLVALQSYTIDNDMVALSNAIFVYRYKKNKELQVSLETATAITNEL